MHKSKINNYFSKINNYFNEQMKEENNQVFYFTFGNFAFGRSEQFPYQDGYVAVIAENLGDATKIFQSTYPNVNEGILNCADYYNSQQFNNYLDSGNKYRNTMHDVLGFDNATEQLIKEIIDKADQYGYDPSVVDKINQQTNILWAEQKPTQAEIDFVATCELAYGFNYPTTTLSVNGMLTKPSYDKKLFNDRLDIELHNINVTREELNNGYFDSQSKMYDAIDALPTPNRILEVNPSPLNRIYAYFNQYGIEAMPLQSASASGALQGFVLNSEKFDNFELNVRKEGGSPYSLEDVKNTYERNGVTQANVIEANSQEQALGYFKKHKPDAELYAIKETTKDHLKPGMPIIDAQTEKLSYFDPKKQKNNRER